MWAVQTFNGKDFYRFNSFSENNSPRGITWAEFKAPVPNEICPDGYFIFRQICSFDFTPAKLNVRYQQEKLDCRISLELHDHYQIAGIAEKVRAEFEKRLTRIRTEPMIDHELLDDYVKNQAEAEKTFTQFEEQGYVILSSCQRKSEPGEVREIKVDEPLSRSERTMIKPSLIELISSLPAELSPPFKSREYYERIMANFT